MSREERRETRVVAASFGEARRVVIAASVLLEAACREGNPRDVEGKGEMTRHGAVVIAASVLLAAASCCEKNFDGMLKGRGEVR